MDLRSCRADRGVLLRRLTAARGTPTLLHLTFLLSRAAAQPGAEGSENPYRSNPNFNPALAIIVVILICAAFFMGFLCIFARKCDEGRSQLSRASGDSSRLPSSGVMGLDRAVIGSFPTFLHSTMKDLKMDGVDGGGRQLECAVCLTEFEDDDALRLLPRCDHAFHANCIDPWFASRTTCPVCRADLSLPEKGELGAESSQWQPPPPQQQSQSLENPDANAVGSHSRTQVAIVIEWRAGGASEEVRSSRTAVKFPRSHSTGHSLSQATTWPREEWEKYTVTLPEEVRSDRELQIGDVDRWVVSMEPPFLSHHGSVRPQAVTDV